MSVLIECAGCRRFVRMTEVRCPFCRATVSASHERARPRARIVGIVTRAALFYGASSLAGCGEPPATAPEAETTEAAPLGPMEPTEVVHDEVRAEPAYAVGPVEIEPEPSEVADAERADAEEGKHDERNRELRRSDVVQRRRDDLRDVVIHSAPPYGAPPFDAPLV